MSQASNSLQEKFELLAGVVVKILAELGSVPRETSEGDAIFSQAIEMVGKAHTLFATSPKAGVTAMREALEELNSAQVVYYAASVGDLALWAKAAGLDFFQVEQIMMHAEHEIVLELRLQHVKEAYELAAAIVYLHERLITVEEWTESLWEEPLAQILLGRLINLAKIASSPLEERIGYLDRAFAAEKGARQLAKPYAVWSEELLPRLQPVGGVYVDSLRREVDYTIGMAETNPEAAAGKMWRTVASAGIYLLQEVLVPQLESVLSRLNSAGEDEAMAAVRQAIWDASDPELRVGERIAIIDAAQADADRALAYAKSRIQKARDAEMDDLHLRFLEGFDVWIRKIGYRISALFNHAEYGAMAKEVYERSSIAVEAFDRDYFKMASDFIWWAIEGSNELIIENLVQGTQNILAELEAYGWHSPQAGILLGTAQSKNRNGGERVYAADEALKEAMRTHTQMLDRMEEDRVARALALQAEEYQREGTIGAVAGIVNFGVVTKEKPDRRCTKTGGVRVEKKLVMEVDEEVLAQKRGKGSRRRISGKASEMAKAAHEQAMRLAVGVAA